VHQKTRWKKRGRQQWNGKNCTWRQNEEKLKYVCKSGHAKRRSKGFERVKGKSQGKDLAKGELHKKRKGKSNCKRVQFRGGGGV